MNVIGKPPENPSSHVWSWGSARGAHHKRKGVNRRVPARNRGVKKDAAPPKEAARQGNKVTPPDSVRFAGRHQARLAPGCNI